MKHTIEYDCKCESCKGSGLYVGFAEGDGFAVVCHTCKGSGRCHRKIVYDDCAKRTELKGIRKVLHINPGIVASASKHRKDGKNFTYESFGGLSYEDWKAGKGFEGAEMRNFVCPAWWYQCADYEKKPNWKECSCGAFPSCENFPQKQKCWKKFDEEKKTKIK